MKSIKPMMMGVVFVCSLSMCFTSCEGTLDDVFGEWSRPTFVDVTSISLDTNDMYLAVGKTAQLKTTVAPDDATIKTVTWSSDNTAAATVDGNGLVTAVAMGTAIITAKTGDKTTTCEVTVTPTLSTPLTFEVLTPGTIVVKSAKASMRYSVNGGAKQAIPFVAYDGIAINDGNDLSVGDKVTFYGTPDSYNGSRITKGTAQVKVYGNILSLFYEDFADKTELPSTSSYHFNRFFYDYVNLKDISGLLLPATTMYHYSYHEMFYGCASLTKAPMLPATMLSMRCYKGMFKGCTKLTKAFVKAAYIAGDPNNECDDMFEGCSENAVLHTIPANKASWDAVMGSGKIWATWTVNDDWKD